MARLTKVDGERALYKDPSSGTYFVRVYHNGTDTFRSLETTRIKEAIERMDARRAAKAAAKLGLTLEPDSAARAVTVADAIQRYVVDGYSQQEDRVEAQGKLLPGETAAFDPYLGWLAIPEVPLAGPIPDTNRIPSQSPSSVEPTASEAPATDQQLSSERLEQTNMPPADVAADSPEAVKEQQKKLRGILEDAFKKAEQAREPK